MLRKIIIIAVPYLLMFLFAYTSLSKLGDRSFFSSQLGLYPYIKHIHVFLSWALPLTELGVVCLLLFPATVRIGLYVSLFLLLVFTAYLGAMVLAGVHLPCSCGGVMRKMSWRQHILFNGFFIVLTGYAFSQWEGTGPEKIL